MPNGATRGRGRTLPELLTTLVISGIFFALLSAAFIGHERLVSGTAAIGEARAQVRHAHQILPAIVRGASVPGADVHAVSDTIVELGYPIATAVVCRASPATQLVLAPDTIAAGQRLAAWAHRPSPGDLAHIFDPGLATGTRDDRWYTAAVNGLGLAPNACAGSALLHPVADGVHVAHTLALGAWLGATPISVPTGALVRFTRRARVELYSASGREHLGYSDFDGSLGRWSPIQPVSGPYYGATNPGIQFALADSLGVALPPGTTAGGVLLRMDVRSRTASQIRIVGMRRGLRAESLTAHIALRNR